MKRYLSALVVCTGVLAVCLSGCSDPNDQPMAPGEWSKNLNAQVLDMCLGAMQNAGSNKQVTSYTACACVSTKLKEKYPFETMKANMALRQGQAGYDDFVSNVTNFSYECTKKSAQTFGN